MKRTSAPRWRRRIAVTLAPLMIFATAQIISTPLLTAANAAPNAGGEFVAAPGRVLDTRAASQIGPYNAPLPANSWRPVPIPSGLGVPSDASSVAVTLTVVAPANSGYLDAAPSGTPPSVLTSFLNFTSGKTISNSAVIPLGANGSLQVKSTVQAHLVIDLQGYYTGGPVGEGGFVPIRPNRILQTETGLGAPTGKMAAGVENALQVGGSAQVPLDAQAAVINVTVSEATDSSYFSANAADAPRQGGFNFRSGETTSMGLTVPLSVSGGVGRIKLFTPTSAHFTVDVVGFYTPTAGGGGFTATRQRLIDTRDSGGRELGPGESLTLRPVGIGATPIEEVGAAVLHIAAVPISAAGSGRLNVFPFASFEPETSSLEYSANRIISNTVTTGLGNKGFFVLTNHGSNAVHVVIDQEGWFTRSSEAPPVEAFVEDVTSTTETVVETYDENQNLVSTQTTVAPTDNEFSEDDSLPANARPTSSSGGGTGCRKVTVSNKFKSYVFRTLLYDYKISTYWCWNRNSATISNVSIDRSFYAASNISYEGQADGDSYFYTWQSGQSRSGYFHWRKGHFKNDFGPWSWGNSYPVNGLRSHSDGTYTRKTSK